MKMELAKNLVWGICIIGVALAANFAGRHGYIGHDTALRVMAMNGLWLAYYGNQIPKPMVPSGCARQARRVAGWMLVLSGLLYAGLFLFAPISVAAQVGSVAVVVGIVVTLGYCVSLRLKARAA
jgi:hypothetical protein